jgi:diphthamide biosynthesis protein 7
MHAGCRVLELCRAKSGAWEFTIIAQFEEHQSMNYGSDVQPCEDEGGNTGRAIVSTSFYDKLMCLWKIELSNSVI